MAEQTTLDAAAKQRVIAALQEQAAADLEALDAQEDAERSAAESDPDLSSRPDDLSQSDAAGDLAGLYADSVDQRAAGLRQVQDLDASLTDRVRDGAVVEFGGARYVVGAVAQTFTVDGVDYEGISSDSPVYAVIDGLAAGDTFEFNGSEQRIDLVA